jgi:hypothetical protein
MAFSVGVAALVQSSGEYPAAAAEQTVAARIGMSGSANRQALVMGVLPFLMGDAVLLAAGRTLSRAARHRNACPRVLSHLLTAVFILILTMSGAFERIHRPAR